MVKLVRRGYTQGQIAQEFGVTQQQVSHDWQLIMVDLAKERSADARVVIDRKLNELAEVKRQAWLAYDKSMTPRLKHIEEESNRGTKLTKHVEQGLPIDRYLTIILDCIREECRLHGLTQDLILQINQQVNNTNNTVNVFDWKALLGRSNSANDLEEKIRMAALPAPSTNGHAHHD